MRRFFKYTLFLFMLQIAVFLPAYNVSAKSLTWDNMFGEVFRNLNKCLSLTDWSGACGDLVDDVKSLTDGLSGGYGNSLTCETNKIALKDCRCHEYGNENDNNCKEGNICVSLDIASKGNELINNLNNEYGSVISELRSIYRASGAIYKVVFFPLYVHLTYEGALSKIVNKVSGIVTDLLNTIKNKFGETSVPHVCRTKQDIKNSPNFYKFLGIDLAVLEREAECRKKGDYIMYDGKNQMFCIGNDNNYNGGTFEGCKAMSVRVTEQRKCFFCPLFTVIFKAMDDVSYSSMANLHKKFMRILLMMMAIYIAITTLNHVSQITKQEAPRYLNTVFKQTFKFAIAYFLLANFHQIYTWVVNPLLNGGLTMANTLVTGGTKYHPGGMDNISSLKVLGIDVYNKLQLFMANVQYKLGFMQAVGQGLICAGGNDLALLSVSHFGSGFQMIAEGVVIALFAFLLSFAFGFYLIDAVVQIGILGSLMPLLILCWPFKITSKYTSKGMGWLINTFMVFVMMSIVISVNFSLIDEAMSTKQTSEADCVLEVKGLERDVFARGLAAVAKAMGVEKKADPSCGNTLLEGGGAARLKSGRVICGPKADLELYPKCNNQKAGDVKNTSAKDMMPDAEGGSLAGIYDAIHTNNYPQLSNMVNIGGKGLLVLIICCIFGFKFVGQATELASEFSGGAVSGIGSSIGTMAGSAIKSTATSVTAPVRNAVSEKVGDKLEAGAQAVGKFAITAPFKTLGVIGRTATKSGRRKNREAFSNAAHKIDRAIGTNLNHEHAQQKAFAKNVANKEGVEMSKRDKNGNRHINYADGTSAIVSANEKIKFEDNVIERRRVDGTMAYMDKNTGKDLTAAQVKARRDRVTMRDEKYNGIGDDKVYTGNHAAVVNAMREKGSIIKKDEQGNVEISYKDGGKLLIDQRGNASFNNDVFHEHNGTFINGKGEKISAETARDKEANMRAREAKFASLFRS